MEDPRTTIVLQLAVQLIASGAPQYHTRSLADVTAEILGSADGIDHTLGICKCSDDDHGGGTVQ